MKRETRTIPVVFVVVSDPIGEGFTANHLSALAGTSVRSSSGSNPRPREERHHSRGATFPLQFPQFTLQSALLPKKRQLVGGKAPKVVIVSIRAPASPAGQKVTVECR